MTGAGSRCPWPRFSAQPGARPGTQAPVPRLGLPGAVRSMGGAIFAAFMMNLCLGRTFNPKAHLLRGSCALRSSSRSSLRCLNDIFKVNTEVFILLKSRAYLNTKTTYIKSLILWSR